MNGFVLKIIFIFKYLTRISAVLLLGGYFRTFCVVNHWVFFLFSFSFFYWTFWSYIFSNGFFFLSMTFCLESFENQLLYFLPSLKGIAVKRLPYLLAFFLLFTLYILPCFIIIPRLFAAVHNSWHLFMPPWRVIIVLNFPRHLELLFRSVFAKKRTIFELLLTHN
jgi:hypothetical protein